MTLGFTTTGLNVEQARRDLGRFPIAASSAGRAWRGVALDRFGSYTVADMIAPPRDHHVITMPLENAPRVYQERCGRTHESASLIGETTVLPAGYKTRWQGRLPAHLCMRVETATLDRVAGELRRAGGARVELCNGFRVRDPVLRRLGMLFDAELGLPDHPAQVLMVEGLAAALAVHLVRGHSGLGGVEDRPALTVDSVHIRRALAYIGDRPCQPIALHELAAAAGLSPYHFAREFRRQVGQTPARYVEQARIAMAMQMISAEALPLSEVALATGFADQSHFTRRFRHHVGCTPGEFALENGRRTHPAGGRPA